MTTETDLLIVGAGPFGLAVAAEAAARGIAHLVVGKPMGFWTDHMPGGMLLRSGTDWHLDPGGEATIERYRDERGLTEDQINPLSLPFYLGYAEWFRARKGIAPVDAWVERLDAAAWSGGGFVATLVDGDTIAARRVVLALGMGPFAHVPPELAALVPPGRGAHTHDRVDFAPLRGERVLILGGRQSAFEWAALIREAGADHVHLSHRHASPAFAEADWSWVTPIVDRMVDDPGWYRRLPPVERQAVGRRLWAEGRLKVEPWLEDRIRRDGITVWPDTRLVACDTLPDGALAATIGTGTTLTVDRVIFATGYAVDLGRIGLLAKGNLTAGVATQDGYPVLDVRFRTTVPGLFLTSMAAGGSFGPFFGFTVSARASARVIGRALAAPSEAVGGRDRLWSG